MPERLKDPHSREDNDKWLHSAPEMYGASVFVKAMEDFMNINPRLQAVPWTDRHTYYFRKWINSPIGTGGDVVRRGIETDVDAEFPILSAHYRQVIRDIDDALKTVTEHPNDGQPSIGYTQGLLRMRLRLQKLEVRELPPVPASSITYIEAISHLDAFRKTLENMIAATEQSAAPPPATTAQPPKPAGEPSLSPSRLKAFQQFKRVTAKRSDLAENLNAAYEYFKDNLYDQEQDGRLVKQSSWVDYVQQALRHPSTTQRPQLPSIKDMPSTRDNKWDS
jgi:hypothetical protein